MRYRLESTVGHGATGVTFRASDLKTNEQVAIKETLLRTADPKGATMAHREAEVLRQLEHPSIPRYRDHLVVKQGRYEVLFLVQDFIDGTTLAEESLHHRFLPTEVLDLMEELLDVLSYLHALTPPVIHRDLKPGNIIRRTSDRRLMLVDFGSVRDALRTTIQGGSTIAGTFGYMAPEQLIGDASPASDYYGLGAIAVSLITRKEPVDMADRTSRIRWHAHAQVTPATATLLDRLLDPDPDQRPQTPAEVRALLKAAREDKGLAAFVTEPAALVVAATPAPPAQGLISATRTMSRREHIGAALAWVPITIGFFGTFVTGITMVGTIASGTEMSRMIGIGAYIPCGVLLLGSIWYRDLLRHGTQIARQSLKQGGVALVVLPFILTMIFRLYQILPSTILPFYHLIQLILEPPVGR